MIPSKFFGICLLRFGICISLVLISVTVALGGEKNTIAIKTEIPYAQGLGGDASLMSRGTSANSIRAKCNLGEILSSVLVKVSKKKGVKIERHAELGDLKATILVMEIEGVFGEIGGAITGTKSMTVRGELRKGETVLGSFVARRQKTSLVRSTCDAHRKIADKIARDIAKWLQKPKMKSRLGSA